MAHFTEEELKKIQKAVEVAKRVNKPTKTTEKKMPDKGGQKQSWVARLKAKVKAALKPGDTTRTKATEAELKKSVTEKEIKKLRGKK